MQDHELPELMTVVQLAQFLQVPVATIYQWRHRGEAPRGLRIGRYVRFRRSDVERWLQLQADAQAS
ncbi:MAG: helix-turn-helix domain-containing protein [Actinomycetota bacterium]|nr:helix-turn-helix domain-containing protein [Actinomycetota bacterium]